MSIFSLYHSLQRKKGKTVKMTELEKLSVEAQNLTLEQVFMLLEQQDFDHLLLQIMSVHPGQLADILEAMPPNERKQLWDLIPESMADETLTFLHATTTWHRPPSPVRCRHINDSDRFGWIYEFFRSRYPISYKVAICI